MDGADAGRLVDGCLLLQRQMQRQMQKGIGFAVFRQPVFVEIIFDVVEIAAVFGMGFQNTQRFVLQAVQRKRVQALLPDMGEKAAHVVGIDVVHGGKIRWFGWRDYTRNQDAAAFQAALMCV
jgi:hypothetical protein